MISPAYRQLLDNFDACTREQAWRHNEELVREMREEHRVRFERDVSRAIALAAVRGDL